MSTTLRTFLADRVRTAIPVHEPRIKPLNLTIDSPDPNEGSLAILLEYEVRSDHLRFNLVFPSTAPTVTNLWASVVGPRAAALPGAAPAPSADHGPPKYRPEPHIPARAKPDQRLPPNFPRFRAVDACPAST